MLALQIANALFIPGLAKGAAGGGIPPVVENCLLLESNGEEFLLESMPECLLLETP